MVKYPSDWKTYSFNDMFKIYPNNTLSRDKLTERGSIGNIHYGDVLIKYGDVLSERDKVPMIKSEYEYVAKTFLQKNDVIIADTAEDATVGKVTQIGEISFPVVGGLHTIVCRPLISTANGYLGYYMNSKEYHNQLLPYITGIKVSSISKSSIQKTEFHVPATIDEQAAIVSVITAFDTHIANLAELIEKKKAIRDGALEDLLSGRTRLDGQCLEWNTWNLNSIAHYGKERILTPRKYYVSTENMRQGFSGIDQYENSEMMQGISFSKGDILIANIRPYLKKIWHAEFNGACSADVLVLQCNDGYNSKFLYYSIANDRYVNYVMAGGIKGIKMPRGDKKYILQYPIFVPKNKKQQEDIAQMLTEMDDEIKALEDERNKIIQIREGAMDDLLTGRVRLEVS